MQERVQKIVAACGIASRRKAEEWIKAGRVMVNGKICSLGDLADAETDTILVDGKPLEKSEEKVYIMLNKPRGYVTTMQDEKGRKTVSQLVDAGVRVYPVGRLDMDSEGLLLMTNDGELTNMLIHPSHEIRKTYEVLVEHYHENGASDMGKAMDIDGYRIRPAEVTLLRVQGSRALLRVTIHEGRNRQIRKMAKQCGMVVLRLKRIREGTLELGDLKVGCWRYLKPAEIAGLKSENQSED